MPQLEWQSVRFRRQAASGAKTRGAVAGAAWPVRGSPAISKRNQRINSPSLTRRRRMISRRLCFIAGKHFATRQNAGRDRGSSSRHPATTARSRTVMGNQQCR